MSLKLFRSTGFHSILSPGETRIALHPGWAVAAVAGWAAAVCNVWLWQALLGRGNAVLALAAGVAAFCFVAAVLSLLGWRRTFKPAATLVLLAAALLAAGSWTQGLELPAVLEGRRLGSLLPGWTAFFGWQVPLLLVLLGLAPMLWLWNTQLRRLSGPGQWKVNLAGFSCYAPLALVAAWALPRLA